MLDDMDWKQRFEVAVLALMAMECRAETAEALLAGEKRIANLQFIPAPPRLTANQRYALKRRIKKAERLST